MDYKIIYNFAETKSKKDMEPMTKVMSFDKIETKADVLKYALEFTAENGKPNYDEARKMFDFFTSLVSLPEVKEDYMKTMVGILDRMNKGDDRIFQFPKMNPDKDVTVDVEKPADDPQPESEEKAAGVEDEEDIF